MNWIWPVWGGPFRTPPIQHPITVGWVLLKVLETIWRLFLVVVVAVALAVGGAFALGLVESAQMEARERSITKAAASIAQRAGRCAKLQIDPGPGANRIRITVQFEVDRSGALTAAPKAVRNTGIDSENAKFEKIVADQAVDTIAKCAPYDGLPDSLYDDANTAKIVMRYKLAD